MATEKRLFFAPTYQESKATVLEYGASCRNPVTLIPKTQVWVWSMLKWENNVLHDSNICNLFWDDAELMPCCAGLSALFI